MKIGIEVHQRLDSHKLFCNCPSISNEGEPYTRILRRLHTVYSETGELDLASKKEFEKGKTYEYLAYDNCNCLVETDEEPPHSLNPQALSIALEIAHQLKCKPVDEIHIMRKTVIDGSNTSGFQRTAIIALDGEIETSKGIVKIPQISIEEESAGIVESTPEKATFSLDRLGIPLVEITTDPSIKDGAHLVEVAEKIGMIMRATGKVARGLGTIRQDLNVSTEGGARVEIKGAQDLKMLPLLAKEEVRRQEELISILKELNSRSNVKVTVKPEFLNASKLFKNTNSKLISSGLSSGSIVLALRLLNHAGLIGREIQTNRRYGTELSDYAKTAGVKGIIHSDEDMNKYTISQEEVSSLRKFLKMSEQDSFVLVVAKEEIAKKALEAVCMRAEMDKIPYETRKANPDGTTSYMRPLPGRARLYPETDILPILVDKKLLNSVEKGESLEEKRSKLEKLLNKEMAEKILRSKNLPLFEKLLELGIEPTLLATTLENTLVSLRREGVELKDLESTLTELFSAYKKDLFVKAALPEILKEVSKGRTVQEVLAEKTFSKIKGKELQKIAQELNFDFGRIMREYRLRIEPQDLSKVKRK